MSVYEIYKIDGLGLMERGFSKASPKQVLRKPLQRYIAFFSTGSGRMPSSQSAGAREPAQATGQSSGLL